MFKKHLSSIVLGAVGAAFLTAAGVAVASRNAAGSYSQASGPWVTGTTISAAAVNQEIADLGAEITNSLSRDGAGPMRAALRLTNGTNAAPSLTFDSETGTGLYRVGAGNPAIAVSGVKLVDWTTSEHITVAGSASAAGLTSLQGALSNGNGTSIIVGRTNTLNDAGSLFFAPNVVAATSSLCLAVIGATTGLCVDGNAATTLNGAAVLNSTLAVTGASTLTGAIAANGILTTNASLKVASGVAADGGGFKHKRGTGGCTTAASAGASCTTTITWTTAFADANYTATCTGNGAVNTPTPGWINSKTASQLVFVTTAVTAAAASFSTIECIAVHD